MGIYEFVTSTTDLLGVLTRSTVLDGSDQDTEWVQSGHQVYNLEGLLDDENGLELLSGVPAVVHHGGGESLYDWALGLPELFNLVSPGGVRDEDL